MQRWIALFGVLAAGPAVANPRPTIDPGTCLVTIVRAPDEVRGEIDRWVAGEHHCKTWLELRAVATPGGYYLLARDGFGREHERVVPDAQTAGVLVASWVADDSYVLAVPGPAEPVDRRRINPFEGNGALMFGTAGPSDPFAPPGSVAARADDELAPLPARRRALTLGTFAGKGTYGLRGELSLPASDRWRVVLAASASRKGVVDFPGDMADMLVTASIGHKWRHVEWRAGAGATRTADHDFRGGYGFFPVLETAVVFTAEGRNWAFDLGPILQVIDRDAPLAGNWPYYKERSEMRLTLFGGLTRKL